MQVQAGEVAYRVRIAAAMDRRQAEAVALALRRRLKQLGIDGANITIAPSRDDIDAPSEDMKRGPAAPSV